jgi:hypothetical protein
MLPSAPLHPLRLKFRHRSFARFSLAAVGGDGGK